MAKNPVIYYVDTKLADEKGSARLIRASSRSAARSKVLSVVTVRKASQQDMLLVLPPNSLQVEDAD
jgi:hypothetical protein